MPYRAAVLYHLSAHRKDAEQGVPRTGIRNNGQLRMRACDELPTAYLRKIAVFVQPDGLLTALVLHHSRGALSRVLLLRDLCLRGDVKTELPT